MSSVRRTLASYSADDAAMALWDLTDRTRPRPLGELVAADGVSEISFSPDGRTVAITSLSQVGLRDLSRLDEARRDHPRRRSGTTPDDLHFLSHDVSRAPSAARSSHGLRPGCRRAVTRVNPREAGLHSFEMASHCGPDRANRGG
jgi:hypothetical protein